MKSTEKILRVGVFTKPLDNWNSGSGHHLDELMHHVLDLVETEKLPFELTFIHYKKSDNPVYERVREIIIPRNPFAASALLRKEKFDVLHYSPLTIFAPIWCIRSKKTATVHGVEEALYPQGYTFFQRFHEARILPMYMRLMDGIATVSETSKRYFVEHYGVHAERIFITTNGLSPVYRVLAPTERSLPEEFGITRPFALHISRYSMRKNPITILNGFARFVTKTGFDWQLVCAGKGWNGEEVRSFAKNAGIEDRLVTPGFISDENAVKLLNNARVFLFPSFAEGFGMPNIEAMASGCPVITSSIFAIPEVVADAAVLLERPDDEEGLAYTIEKIEKEPEFKKALISRGLVRAGMFNWDDSAKALVGAWKLLGVKCDEHGSKKNQ